MTKVEVATRDSGTNTSWLLLAAPGMALMLLGAAVMGYEALYLGLFAAADSVASYHFGSEAMVGVGGWAYTSREAYVASSAVFAVAAGALASVFVVGVRQRHVRWLAAGYTGIALWLAVVWYPIWGSW